MFIDYTLFQSMIGHCLGASGGLEAIATVKAIQTGWLHPSINQFVCQYSLGFSVLVGFCLWGFWKLFTKHSTTWFDFLFNVFWLLTIIEMVSDMWLVLSFNRIQNHRSSLTLLQM